MEIPTPAPGIFALHSALLASSAICWKLPEKAIGRNEEVTGSLPRTRHTVVALPPDPASNDATGRRGGFRFSHQPSLLAPHFFRLIRSDLSQESVAESY